MGTSINNQTAMLSGSTGGIGVEIAKLLADRGWDLVLVNRSRDKSLKQANELSDQFPGISIDVFEADLLDQTQIVGVCQEISNSHPMLAAVYNVAGILTQQRFNSKQGLEAHFAVNTVAPFLFAKHLRSVLKTEAASGVRPAVVNFGSSAVNSVKKLDVQALADPIEIGGLMGAYANSKLALMAMTKAFSDESDKVLYLSVDPGATKTSMTQSGDGMPWYLKPLVPFLFKPADVQAKRIVDGVQKVMFWKTSLESISRAGVWHVTQRLLTRNLCNRK